MIGGVLAIVGVFLDFWFRTSYWDYDGTVAWAGLILGAGALILVAIGFSGRSMDSWVFAIGAFLIGYWGWFPAVAAFDSWKHTGMGAWLCLGGAALIAAGGAASLQLAGGVRTTPAGVSAPALVTAIGIALVFPGIFLHADQGTSYWNGPLGHSLGVTMLVVAVLCALAWVATVAGVRTRGLDAALTLVLLGLAAFDPFYEAFNNLADLEAGAWLALAGGILAAGGVWATRGTDVSHPAAAAS